MLQAERMALIERFLQERGGTLSTGEVIERLGVSRETARRDFWQMHHQGLLIKVRGGVVQKQVREEPTYFHRAVTHIEQKRAIANIAQELVEDGDTLFLDSGTTLLQFARALLDKPNLTVLTNGLPIAMLLAEHEMPVYVTGGRLRAGDLALTGRLAESSVDSLYVDKAFVGAGGVTLQHGVTDFHMEEVSLRKKVMEKAAHCYLLADSSKYGTNAFVKLGSLKDFDAWITDDDLLADAAAQLRDAGVQVLTPGVRESS